MPAAQSQHSQWPQRSAAPSASPHTEQDAASTSVSEPPLILQRQHARAAARTANNALLRQRQHARAAVRETLGANA
jgi:hypothetical protein